MEQYVIKGGNPLVGEVEIAGAKNAALAILAAAIMTDETILIENLPDVRDINVLLEAIAGIGAQVDRIDKSTVKIKGKALTGKEFDQAIHAYETMYKECNIDLCASMGFLSSEQLHRLHEAGVTSYHHNIETSRRNFPNICTTHTYDMKIETLKKVKAEGMCACSGGIIGMGETWEDRLDMAVSLAELGIDSIPINALMPIPGTPLEHLDQLSEQDILRTIAFFRYINPEANIRLAAGRALLINDGETAFKSGASATITGNMLTTVACATIRSDRKMLSDMGRNVTPEYWKEVEES